MMRSFSLITLLSALPVIGAQFVAAPIDLNETTGYLNLPVRYKEVPTGICETDPGVKSYSGYVDVREDQHIFFWFFEARNEDPEDAPLTMWLNGGPGASSLVGLFQENGPCGIDADGNVYNNPYSWTNASNMLYIDQPVLAGFSYSIAVPGYIDPNTGDIVELPSNNCPDDAADWSCGAYAYSNASLTANSTITAAPNFYLALQGFMGAFPQYSRESFHLATESYGGHFGPVFGQYIDQQNELLRPGAKNISLGSVMIGNGWYDSIIQFQAYYNFTVYPGNTYDYFPFNDSISSLLYENLYGPGNCIDQQLACKAQGINDVCRNADNYCGYQVELIYDNYSGRDENDISALAPDPVPYKYFINYLNTPTVQAAIGAYTNFTEVSTAIVNAFSKTGDDSRLMNTVQDMGELLARNVSVIMYAGDADYNCNWLGSQAVSLEVDAPSFSSAGFVNITTDDGIVHGQVKQAGNFAFVRVYNSGHEVPFYQPELSLSMFGRVISGFDIATGLVSIDSGYQTVGSSESTFRQGNSSIQF